MHFEFRLTFKDYFTALSLHARRGLVPFVFHVLALYIFPVWGLCLLALTIMNGNERADFWSYAAPAYLIGCPFLVLFLYRLKFKRSQMDSGECTLDLGDVILVRGRHSKTELEWSAIKRYKEGKKMFLLYLAPGKFIPIPKRVCSGQDAAELRALLQERVGKNSPAMK